MKETYIFKTHTDATENLGYCVLLKLIYVYFQMNADVIFSYFGWLNT